MGCLFQISCTGVHTLPGVKIEAWLADPAPCAGPRAAETAQRALRANKTV
jgi:hypothetical protein